MAPRHGRGDNPHDVGNAILLHAPFVSGPAPGWAPALLEALPYLKRQDLERREPAARTASLHGLALALVAATRLDERTVPIHELRFGKQGRPELVDGPWLSISHTQTRVACIATRACETGLDVETIPTSPDRATLRKLRRWTTVEAVLKAAGAGVRHAEDVAIVARGPNAIARFGEHTFRAWQVKLAADVMAQVAARERLDVAIDELRLDDVAISTTVERSLGLAT